MTRRPIYIHIRYMYSTHSEEVANRRRKQRDQCVTSNSLPVMFPHRHPGVVRTNASHPVSQSVKDVLQELMDDGLVCFDKMSAGYPLLSCRSYPVVLDLLTHTAAPAIVCLCLMFLIMSAS
jgi:hypothetical protein